MRLHGGRGYTTAYDVERQLRDALGGLYVSGTSDVLRSFIAQLM
jgi:alkylation response protein AidB-like acyl-CoA dehydrogenase